MNKPAAVLVSPNEPRLQRRIETHLELILATPLFHQSRRSSMLLRFIVEETLKGSIRTDLKERVLGAQVFGRATDYDTNTDPVVRMAAGELRKKLAQYYYTAEDDLDVMIELPSGSYVPRFLITEPHEQEPPAEAPPEIAVVPASEPAASETAASETTAFVADEAPVRRPMWRRIVLPAAVAVALVVATVIGTLLTIEHGSPNRKFWTAFADPGHKVLIVLPIVRINPAAFDGYHYEGVPVAMEDAASAAKLSAILYQHGNLSDFALAPATTLDALRSGPSILIGALDNPWTLRFSQTLPFGFERSADHRFGRIASHGSNTHQEWVQDFNITSNEIQRDYGIVAFFRESTTEAPTMIVAGISAHGTRAAGEAVSNPKYLSEILSRRKAGTQYFEAIIETEVVNGLSGPPHIVTIQSW